MECVRQEPLDWDVLDVRRMLRALEVLSQHPERTDLVGEFLAGSGAGGYRDLYFELMDDPEAREILLSGRELLQTLRDRPRLGALPRGTLGREYFEWTEARHHDAKGLADTIHQVPRELTTTLEVLSARMVDMHDLWHILMGWHDDMLGEMHLLGFSYAQLRSPGWLYLGLLFCLGLSAGGRHEGFAYFLRAFMLGKRAERLAGLDWEALLERPLDDLRRELGVPEPRPYRQMSIPEWRAMFSRTWIARTDRWLRRDTSSRA